MASPDPRSEFPPRSASFPTTAWTSVVQAPPAERADRLKALLARCWRPVFAFIRNGWCATDDDAMDLTQEFVLRMLEGDALEKYDRDRSRFRRFVKACLQNFLSRERRDAGRQKRGGDRRTLSLDLVAESSSTLLPASPDEGPDAAFDREWAASLLLESSQQLQEDLDREGRKLRFEIWKLCVLDRPSGDAITYKDAASRLGMTEASVRETLFQLRRRFRQILLRRVSDFVASPEDLFSEFKELFANNRGGIL